LHRQLKELLADEEGVEVTLVRKDCHITSSTTSDRKGQL
jgi:hypothetical protein